MSVYYEIKEHLVVKSTEEQQEIAKIAISQLKLLGEFIQQDRATVNEMTALADGEKFCFSGNSLTEDYHELIRALTAAKTFELISSYHYGISAPDIDPGPFVMVEHLEDVVTRNPNALKGVFYTMWNSADCSVSAGALVAFGEKNGHMYTGEVAFQPVESISAGDWYTPLTAVVYDAEPSESKDLAAIEAVCRQMCEFSECDQLEIDEEGGFSFALNNLRITSDDQLKAFINLSAKLIELTDGDCGLIGELADVSGPDVSLLHFDVEADGTYELKLAAIL